MADLTQRPPKQIRFPEGYLLCWQKSHWQGGVQRIIYLRPRWTRQRNLFTIIWLLSFFGRACTQHLREEPIMACCLLMASAVASCTGKSQWRWEMIVVCVLVSMCLCVLRLNGTANRKLGTPGPSALCHGSHVTL